MAENKQDAEYSMPNPKDRRTLGAYRRPDEAMNAGRDLIHLMNGVPVGFQFSVYERLGAFVLISHPKDHRR